MFAPPCLHLDGLQLLLAACLPYGGPVGGRRGVPQGQGIGVVRECVASASASMLNFADFQPTSSLARNRLGPTLCTTTSSSAKVQMMATVRSMASTSSLQH
jgi:hypothetical protein